MGAVLRRSSSSSNRRYSRAASRSDVGDGLDGDGEESADCAGESRVPRRRSRGESYWSGGLCCVDGGGPVGVETLSAALAEERDVIEDVIEPYLMQEGLLQRTPRGRILARQGWSYLGIEAPKTAMEQLDLLGTFDDVEVPDA